MFLPISTDAPIYHMPFATVGLIITNTFLFFAVLMGHNSILEGLLLEQNTWLLTYGNGLHPMQWLTSAFMHVSFGHLLGNMLFLWVFGLIVEGKLGWWKFLLVYLGIAVVQSALQQLVMLGYTGPSHGSLGASSAIYGLLAITCLWAPVNEFTVLYFIFYIPRTFEIKIWVLSLLFLLWQAIMVIAFQEQAATEMLHLSGAAVGAVVGFAMLKFNLVDCEYWDALSILAGHKGEPPKPKQPEVFPGQPPKKPLVDNEAFHKQVQIYLKNNNPQGVAKLVQKLQKPGGSPVELNQNELLQLIQLFHKQEAWKASAPWMAEFIKRFPSEADRVRLKLAHICLAVLSRPGRAIELLEPIETKTLPTELATFYRRLMATAQKQVEEGTVELDDGKW